MRSYRWDDSDDEENVVSVMRLGAQVSVADARAITDVAFAFREETRVLEVTLA